MEVSHDGAEVGVAVGAFVSPLKVGFDVTGLFVGVDDGCVVGILVTGISVGTPVGCPVGWLVGCPLGWYVHASILVAPKDSVTLSSGHWSHCDAPA